MDLAKILVLALCLCVELVDGKTVTIRNGLPRKDVNGNYIDAHDGKIVAHNGKAF